MNAVAGIRVKRQSQCFYATRPKREVKSRKQNDAVFCLSLLFIHGDKRRTRECVVPVSLFSSAPDSTDTAAAAVVHDAPNCPVLKSSAGVLMLQRSLIRLGAGKIAHRSLSPPILSSHVPV